MKVVGLTGGIASGKSTVATRWRQLGVHVIDADQVAREVVEPGQPALEKISRHFGKRVICDDGTLDRSKLGEIVFSDPQQLQALNRITHPAIATSVRSELTKLRAEGRSWCVYEAALIVDNGLSPALFELVAVICDPAVQHRRLMARNHLNSEQAWQRINAQVSNEQRRQAANVVIDNNGSLEALMRRADGLVKGYKERFASG